MTNTRPPICSSLRMAWAPLAALIFFCRPALSEPEANAQSCAIEVTVTLKTDLAKTKIYNVPASSPQECREFAQAYQYKTSDRVKNKKVTARWNGAQVKLK